MSGEPARDLRAVDVFRPPVGPSSPRKLALILMLACVAFAGMELLCWVAGRFLETKGVFYNPEDVEGYATYLADRDPVLGWPSRDFADDPTRDETGSRIVPAFPDTRESCLSIYGDSFTWSAEVDDEHAWGNELSRMLGCRVANFGVRGYGSDQAYLRFLGNQGDHAPVVLLAHLSENILRNVNQLRALLYPGTRYGLKPRFVLGPTGELVHIPIPSLSEAQYRDMLENPARYLEHEYFLPGGPAGPLQLTFPYSLSVLRSFAHFHISAELRDEPWYAAFYSRDHPSGALQVTSAILEAFSREARARGRQPIVAVIPTGRDLEYFRRRGRWVYRPLIEELERRDVTVLDAGPGMIATIGDRGVCTVFGPEGCAGHPNEAGYAIIAQVVSEYLRSTGLVGLVHYARR